MEVKFDVFDYLTPEEIREECKQTIRGCVREMFAKNESEIDRLISNLGYEFIFEAVSEAIGKDARAEIAAVVKKLASDESHIRYVMWRRKDAWERRESPAIGILEQAVVDNKWLIRDCVQKAIAEFDFPDVREAMYDVACNIVSEKLFGTGTEG